MSGDTAMRCDAQYGKNPDRCYLQARHRGPHSNRWGTTWDDLGLILRAALPDDREETQR